MAKLTDDQKAANKAERKVRDVAFNARYKLYIAARNETERTWKSSSEYAALEKVDAERDAVMAEKRDGVRAIEAQIAALRAQLEEFQERCDTRIAPLNEARSAAWSERARAQRVLLDEVDRRFPDLFRVHSAGGWNPNLVPKD